jgi:hypothetical protein
VDRRSLACSCILRGFASSESERSPWHERRQGHRGRLGVGGHRYRDIERVDRVPHRTWPGLAIRPPPGWPAVCQVQRSAGPWQCGSRRVDAFTHAAAWASRTSARFDSVSWAMAVAMRRCCSSSSSRRHASTARRFRSAKSVARQAEMAVHKCPNSRVARTWLGWRSFRDQAADGHGYHRRQSACRLLHSPARNHLLICRRR